MYQLREVGREWLETWGISYNDAMLNDMVELLRSMKREDRENELNSPSFISYCVDCGKEACECY